MVWSLKAFRCFRSGRDGEVSEGGVIVFNLKGAEVIEIVHVYYLLVFTSCLQWRELDVRKAAASRVTTPAESDESGGKVAGEVFQL